MIYIKFIRLPAGLGDDKLAKMAFGVCGVKILISEITPDSASPVILWGDPLTQYLTVLG